jgi:pimeloyl-ACP methyl ester carboxylesterase
MATINIPETVNRQRRQFLGSAAITMAAAKFGMIGSAAAQSRTPTLPAIKPGTNTSFASLKQVDAGVLNIGYAEAGPADGPVAILLHGWPYDIHTYVDVAPLLASAGYRVIVPYLRGYGATRFVSGDTARNGQQSVVAVDVIALMDALKIEKATVAGCDWGARTACIVAALWPERCKALVSVSGYLIGSQQAGRTPLPPMPNCNGGINIISPPNAAGPATKNTAESFRSSSGSSPRRSGSSMTPRSIAARRLSKTRTTSPS